MQLEYREFLRRYNIEVCCEDGIEEEFTKDYNYSHSLYFPCIHVKPTDLEFGDVLVYTYKDSRFETNIEKEPRVSSFGAASIIRQSTVIINHALEGLLKEKGWI